jgi:hypothetical protein
MEGILVVLMIWFILSIVTTPFVAAFIHTVDKGMKRKTPLRSQVNLDQQRESSIDSLGTSKRFVEDRR